MAFMISTMLLLGTNGKSHGQYSGTQGLGHRHTSPSPILLVAVLVPCYRVPPFRYLQCPMSIESPCLTHTLHVGVPLPL